MPAQPVRAVTFDLWDCIFIDDSDEPKRAAAGLPPKSEARRQLIHGYLDRQASIPRETVDLAFDVTDRAYSRVWHDFHVTWTVSERLDVLFGGLGRQLPAAEFAELVRRLEHMELEFRPDPVPGVHMTLMALKKRYKLAVISDAIFSPGRALRELLKGEGLLDYFDVCVFSDEAGCSKPSPRVFEAAARGLGVALDEIVHIGDRPHNDVDGAHEAGARAVLFTAAKARDLDGLQPDAVCDSYDKLPSILEELGR